jgi:hypothetical protein
MLFIRKSRYGLRREDSRELLEVDASHDVFNTIQKMLFSTMRVL